MVHLIESSKKHISVVVTRGWNPQGQICNHGAFDCKLVTPTLFRWNDEKTTIKMFQSFEMKTVPMHLCTYVVNLIGFFVTYMAPQTITNFLISCLLQYVTWGMISVSPWETDRPTLYPTLRPIHRPTGPTPRTSHDICNFFADCVHFSANNAN